jgi:RNA polymerase sigma-70 factor (ECF subfamily)
MFPAHRGSESARSTINPDVSTLAAPTGSIFQLEPAPQFGQRAFVTTHWSTVLAAGSGGSPAAEAALERLCLCYREPVQQYLLNRGIRAGDAEDLVQGFFASLLKRNSFSRVAPERGRFRTYLKRALRYFLLDQRRPLPPGLLVELDALSGPERDTWEPRTNLHPADALDRAWAEQVLHLAYQRLEREPRSSEEARIFLQLRHLLAEEPAEGEYATLAAEMGVAPNTLAKRVQRLREDFDACVRTELLETVGTPAEVEAEVRALFA